MVPNDNNMDISWTRWQGQVSSTRLSLKPYQNLTKHHLEIYYHDLTEKSADHSVQKKAVGPKPQLICAEMHYKLQPRPHRTLDFQLVAVPSFWHIRFGSMTFATSFFFPLSADQPTSNSFPVSMTIATSQAL